MMPPGARAVVVNAGGSYRDDGDCDDDQCDDEEISHVDLIRTLSVILNGVGHADWNLISTLLEKWW